MSYRTLKVSLDSRGVLTIALNRPEVRNAFNDEVVQDLTHAFQNEACSAQVRAILLKGEGPVFCAGGDLNWMQKAAKYSAQENLEDSRALAKMFSLLNQCSKPIIGLVQGAAIGGGVGLVSICDTVIAHEETQFSLSEVRLGIIPACIGPFVIAKIGPSHARSLFTSAQRFQARHAQQIGLIHEVVSGDWHSSSEKAAERILENILQCGPAAITAAKQLIYDLSWPERRTQIGDPIDYVAKMLADIRASDEGKEGVLAFLEKRKPQWQKF